MYLKNFPEKLKNLRLSYNLTQSELAEILHTTKQAVSSYESGKAQPSLNSLIRLSEHFNISLDSLVFDRHNINSINLSSNKDSNLILNLLSIKSKIDDMLKDLSNTSNSQTRKDTKVKDGFDVSISNIIDFKENKENIQCREIPILGDVAAGNPCYAPGDILDYFYIPEDKLLPYKDYYILNIKGDSMNKLFNDKDLILVECTSLISTSDIAIVLVNNEEATVKKVDITEHNITLIPLSSNPIHKSKTYNINDVCVQGKVVCKISDLFKPTFTK